MSPTTIREAPRPLHPLHAILLGFPPPLFLGALLADLAYRTSFHVQWANFASWLIAAGLLGGGFALLWALVALIRGGAAGRRRAAILVAVLAGMWVLGLVNALVHAKDAFATMPEGLYLSAVVTLLAFVAAWMGYAGYAAGARAERSEATSAASPGASRGASTRTPTPASRGAATRAATPASRGASRGAA